MHTIICSGMMRSGSTWSFNVCRLLYSTIAEKLNQPAESGYMDGEAVDDFLEEADFEEEKFVVIKAHTPGPKTLERIDNGVVKNVCTFRDPRDAVASRRTFQDEPFEESMEWIKRNIKFMHRYAQTQQTLFIRYEDMMRDSLSQIRALGRYLGADLNERLIRDLDHNTNFARSRAMASRVKELPSEQLYQDRTHTVDRLTNLHENHIQSGKTGRWRTELTEEENRVLLNAFGKILVSLNYETERSLNELVARYG